MSIVTPFIRTNKKNRHGRCSIGLRFEVNGKQAILSLDQKVYPSQWSRAKNRVLPAAKEAGVINPVIETALA